MFLEGLWRDIVYGARMLWQKRAYTAIGVLTLALGIGANTAIFSVVRGVALRPLPYHEPDRLVRLGVTCALCHSTVDNSFAPGIGHRLDGWPNRDLNVGAIVALSPADVPPAPLAPPVPLGASEG